ncbi:hypothetical protein BH23ACT10_BH23ACT10_17660 [soil metagenome]
MLAGFAAVLARYGRSDAVTFGCVTRVQGLLGVTVEIDPEVRPRPWIERVSDAVASVASLEDGGRNLMAKALGAEAGELDHLLRRAVFIIDEDDATGGHPPLDGEIVARVGRAGGARDLVIDYDAGLFDRATVERFGAHVATIVDHMLADASRRLSEVSLLTFDEREALAGFNATGVDYPTDVTLVSLFEAQVAATPDAPAVTDHDGTTFTYAEFDARTNQLAWWLSDHGVTAGTLVGVFAHRGIDMLTALYGIHKAGGAYVPLDPDHPDDRLRFMIDEAAMPVVLTQDHLADRMTALTATADQPTTIATIATTTTDQPTDPPSVSVDPDGLAYAIYTSGSTGRPKGVMLKHRNVAHQMLWMQQYFELDPSDRMLLKTPFSFDMSVWELFWPLSAGAHLVIAAPDGHRDAGYLIETITGHDITTIAVVPSMLRLFLDHPDAATATSLKRVVCIGEALTADLRDRFFDRISCELHNLYGPTEAAVSATAWQCHSDDDDPVVPIGRPIANTTIHILDDHLNPTPIGVPGELHIGGVQVARGYLRRPELTAERFIADPFTDDPNARLYKTGDLARWLPDGTIDFLGRLDFQVKLHGLRIELGEIEATLGAHPAIRDATVILHTDDRGHSRLVAHLVPRIDASVPPPSALRRHLSAKLPGYMVPEVYAAHEALPLTASGKVDRNALAAQPLPRASHGTLGRNELELFIADVWAGILGVPAVGINERFFELGGSSLQAAEFVNRMQLELGETIFVVTVFTAPTVADYAAFLQREYPAAVARRFDLHPPSPFARVPTASPSLDDDGILERMRALVPSVAPFTTWTGREKNRRAAFILSPPRSGTTLLRVMLAGHPDLFAAPELQLLNFDTVEQRQAALEGRFSAWLEGTIRAVMELDDCDAGRARRVIDDHRRTRATTKELYVTIQERAGSRLLIDKSPAYALDPAVLRNAEDGFEDPVYLHLVRDPMSTVRSFERHRVEQILWLKDHDMSSRLLAEAVWYLSHRTILEFLDTVPPDRQLRLRFEDLVADPRPVMQSVARCLGVDFDERLLDPYADLESKMVDGITPASMPMGDTRLLERHRIDPTAARHWDDVADGPTLAQLTVKLASALGYTEPRDGGDRRAGRTRRRFASQARERRARSRHARRA